MYPWYLWVIAAALLVWAALMGFGLGSSDMVHNILVAL